MATFRTKRNDTKPMDEFLEREQTPGEEDFEAINLAPGGSAATVRWLLRDMEDPPNVVMQGDAEVLDAPTGHVVWRFPDGGITEAGEYQQEWEITYADGEVETVPPDGYNKVVVLADVA